MGYEGGNTKIGYFDPFFIEGVLVTGVSEFSKWAVGRGRIVQGRGRSSRPGVGGLCGEEVMFCNISC